MQLVRERERERPLTKLDWAATTGERTVLEECKATDGYCESNEGILAKGEERGVARLTLEERGRRSGRTVALPVIAAAETIIDSTEGIKRRRTAGIGKL